MVSGYKPFPKGVKVDLKIFLPEIENKIDQKTGFEKMPQNGLQFAIRTNGEEKYYRRKNDQ